MPVNLPVVRSGERMDYKRCQKKWYWAWRRGLVPKAKTFGALDLGAWMHVALAAWYAPGQKRNGSLNEHFRRAALAAIVEAQNAGAPDYIVEKAEELHALGELMAEAYEQHYGTDDGVHVLQAEIPLEFTFKDGVVHKLKPDLVYMDSFGHVWLMEHKTAKSIQTGHLVIDDQARPYGAMAELVLRKLGLIKHDQQFRGIMYNFLRKALTDQRPQNAEGKYLNKDGAVSKSQPPPYFVRKPITMTNKARQRTLIRLHNETQDISVKTLALRHKELSPKHLQKTPHKSCERFCQFFTMCVAEEEGSDIRDMERLMYTRRNPYIYEEETTEERMGFEII